jgi:uncharacterized protein YjbI with pentapeptide repeats
MKTPFNIKLRTFRKIKKQNTQFNIFEKFRGKDLTQMDFSGTNFSNANLINASFINVDFSGANFSNVNFFSVCFSNANFYATRFGAKTLLQIHKKNYKNDMIDTK